jgi:HflC protein
MNFKIISGIIAALIVAVAFMCAYTVDETEQVVITQFSKVNRTVPDPGLHFKFPVIERAVVYPRNLQEWDGDPGEIPTKDKTYIYVDTFARWKIVDPVLFFKTVGIESRLATNRLNEIIDPAVRNLITSNRLIETVRNTNRELDTFEEGPCVQIMHIGPYATEMETVGIMREYMDANGLRVRVGEDGLHHEIYVGDPRKAAPDKLKTVVRHPVAKKVS